MLIDLLINSELIARVVDDLVNARKTHRPAKNVTALIPDISVNQAYEIQLELLKNIKSDEDPVVGGKIGLSSKANQQKFGISEPIFGHLTASMIIPEGDPISMSTLFRPVVEPEICFLLSRDLTGPGVNSGTVISATEGVMPAIEIADNRFENASSRAEDNVADNSGASLVVLGGMVSPLAGMDLRLIGMVLEENGEVISTGAGAAVLGNPSHAVASLANKLSLFGMSLKAGDIVISGTPVAAVPARTGAFFRTTFDRIGSVSVRFTE